jgi:hypothetical protein
MKCYSQTNSYGISKLRPSILSGVFLCTESSPVTVALVHNVWLGRLWPNNITSGTVIRTGKKNFENKLYNVWYNEINVIYLNIINHKHKHNESNTQFKFISYY